MCVRRAFAACFWDGGLSLGGDWRKGDAMQWGYTDYSTNARDKNIIPYLHFHKAQKGSKVRETRGRWCREWSCTRRYEQFSKGECKPSGVTRDYKATLKQ